MKFKYDIKGITLDISDMIKVNEYYQAACTAEYLMDNENVENEELAMELGYEVRRVMDKYDMAEDDAIEEVLAKRF